MPKAQLNTQAPNFTLTNFKGQSINLTDFEEKQNVLLVFNRGFT